ncbi:zinc finger protein 585a [Colletotrichum tofieldiae]|nr:zinc finger protein 585a [Colletotrichum tofieldiae]
MSKHASDLEQLRERLRKRAASSEAFNKIWESEGLPHLRKTLNDNYNGDYSITIQFNYTASKRVVEVMTPDILPSGVDQKVKRNVMSCFEDAQQLRVEVQFLVGTIRHTADTTHSSQDLEDDWVKARNPTKHLVQIKDGSSTGIFFRVSKIGESFVEHLMSLRIIWFTQHQSIAKGATDRKESQSFMHIQGACSRPGVLPSPSGGL